MLDKICSSCHSSEQVQIETVTNIMPVPEEMLPVLLCAECKQALQKKQLDIRMGNDGKLKFILKKSS